MHRDQLRQMARDLDVIEARLRGVERQVTNVRGRIEEALGERIGHHDDGCVCGLCARRQARKQQVLRGMKL